MSSKMKQNVAAIMAMALAMGEGQGMMFTGRGEEAFVYLPKDPIPPAGTKTYFFNELGEFSTEQMRKDECVFKCFAINDKNAKRKFERWRNCI
jgi:hypothetical protein